MEELIIPVCFNCGIQSGEKYNTGYYQLSGLIYCSLNCFHTKYKELNVRRESGPEKPRRTRKAAKRKSATKKGRRSSVR